LPLLFKEASRYEIIKDICEFFASMEGNEREKEKKRFIYKENIVSFVQRQTGSISRSHLIK